MISDQVTGLLVPPGQADALARALADLIKDETKAIRMGLTGRLLVERKFTSHIHAEHMQAIYSELLAK